MRDLPVNVGAYAFGNGTTAKVSIGTGIGRLQNYDPISIMQVIYPTVWPAAGVRANFYINGSGTGFRQFATSTDGGVNGLRFLLDRDTADLNVTVTVGNLPYAAINKWCVVAVVADTTLADNQQFLYGGDLQHALTPVTTYVTQTAGSGTVFPSSNANETIIGGTGGATSYAGSIAVTAVWNRRLTLALLRQYQWMLLSGQIPRDAQGVWYTGAHGPQKVYDLSGIHDTGGFQISQHATPTGISMSRGFDLRRMLKAGLKASAAAGYLLVKN